MGKLKYYYGTMASGKTATLLMNVHQKKLNGTDCIVLKPSEKRDGNIIKSRVGLESECTIFFPAHNLYFLLDKLSRFNNVNVFYIDECQFLTPAQVKQLWKASRRFNLTINCFGLKTTFKNELFEGIKTMMVYADQIQELEPKAVCKYCKEDATTHLLVVEDKIVLDFPEKFEGDVEGSIRFECVCQHCWEKHTRELRE